jgi:hypothetical protein
VLVFIDTTIPEVYYHTPELIYTRSDSVYLWLSIRRTRGVCQRCKELPDCIEMHQSHASSLQRFSPPSEVR